MRVARIWGFVRRESPSKTSMKSAIQSVAAPGSTSPIRRRSRSEEHTSELQSPCNLVCRLLLEKKKTLHAQIIAGKRASYRGPASCPQKEEPLVPGRIRNDSAFARHAR